MNWKDGTSYSKFDHERIPRIWELPITKKITLVVHRHIYDKSTWFMTLRHLGNTVINMLNLNTDDENQAKAYAIDMTLEYLCCQKEEIESAIQRLRQ